MTINNVYELFSKEIQEILNMEKQIKDALISQSEKAYGQKLKNILLTHLDQTKTHIERIESIAKNLDIPVQERKCLGVEGLIKEEIEQMKINLSPQIKDLALISAIRDIEGYEISRYNNALLHAQILKNDPTILSLEQTLKEETDIDGNLLQLVQIYV